MAKKKHAGSAGASGSAGNVGLGATGGVAKTANQPPPPPPPSPPPPPPPYICVAIKWGKSMLEDVDDILGLPTQLSLHRVSGTNIVPPVRNPPIQSPANPVVFNEAFPGEDGMKYDMMTLWYNVEKNILQGNNRYKEHQHDLWRRQCSSHAMQLYMTQHEYYDFGLRVFENVKNTLQNGIRNYRKSVSFGDTDTRELDVGKFLKHLRKRKGIKGSIHVKKREMAPPGMTPGKYQTLHQLRLYLDPTKIDHLDSSSYIAPPDYPKGKVQGNYKPGKPVYLI